MADEKSSTTNFIEMEKKWLDHWYKSGIIQKYLHKNDASDKRFSFIDGPITANNPMGVHHAWGRTYKDVWRKFFNLLGYKQRFQNGFDCQGLWVEVEVEKELGVKTKKDIENLVPGDKKASIAKFVELCKARVLKFSEIQTDQSKRLCYFLDWENSYYTMSAENNYMIWYFLKKCYEHGWIYKGHDSVPWCPRCETAISQHEILTENYAEITHDSIFFKLPILGRTNEFLLVWTTTPWTIPANVAVAVEEKYEYALVEGETGLHFWVLKDLVEKVFGKNYKRIVKTALGKELVGLHYEGPFDALPAVAAVAKENPEMFHVVVATDEKIMPITTEEGTGLVHTAVGAGTEDFNLGKKRGLPLIAVIQDNADYLDGFGEFSGKNAKKHPELIIEYLKTYKDGAFLFSVLKYKHRYPTCWRCKTELVWKVADEWYIAMDKPSNNKTLRERMIEVANKIKWMPEFGLDRELDWLNNMHDWLISKKNRFWGLALPIYECTKCNHFEVLGGYDELKQRAVEGFAEFEGHSPHKPFIDEVKIRCSQCGETVSRVDDVGNVWLDAGIVPYSTLVDPKTGKPSYITDKEYFHQWFPADFITESFPGQFKNWFYSLIAMSSVLEETNPFKTVLGYGTQLAEDGRPMHKSWGNSIEFNEGADAIGVDVMRWMFARHNPSDNMLFGYKRADEVRRQFYLMLYNVYKYYLEYSVLDEIDLTTSPAQLSDVTSTNVLDQWLLSRFTGIVRFVEEHMRAYDSNASALEIERFVSDFSTWFIRRSRDRVWIHSDDTADKQGFYRTYYAVLVNLSIVLSPFMAALPEEMYTTLTGKESVHLASWPDISQVSEDLALNKDMEKLRSIVEVGQRVRKDAKLKVRQPLASLTVMLPITYEFEKSENQSQYDALLKEELNVKSIFYSSSKESEINATYDTVLTPELVKEGELRELLRTIQAERKNKGITINEAVSLVVPQKFEEYGDVIKKSVNVSKISFGDSLQIET
ncbi:isoleucine--tRNA ligase [Candidatus Roizmanbacteria bacterium]|nr:isoleucine--tRNA ligase [Candidatus Roizmanbacteria bacterium]